MTYAHLDLDLPCSETMASLTFRVCLVATGAILDQTLLRFFPALERLLPRAPCFEGDKADMVHVLDGFKIYLQSPLDTTTNKQLYNSYKDETAAQVILNLGASVYYRGHSLVTVGETLPPPSPRVRVCVCGACAYRWLTTSTQPASQLRRPRRPCARRMPARGGWTYTKPTPRRQTKASGWESFWRGTA